MRNTAYALFCFITSLYLLTYKGICTGDNIFHYEVVQNFIRTGDLSIPEGKYNLDTKKWLQVWLAKGRDEKIYLTSGYGLALASVPLGLVGYIIEKITDGSELQNLMKKTGDNTSKLLHYLRKTLSAFFASLINPILCALVVFVFFSFSQKITNSNKKTLISALILGCSTIIWSYSSTYWTQPLITFCLFSSFYFIFVYSQKDKFKYLLFAGLFAGYAFITRFETILTIPWLILYVLIVRWRAKQKLLKSVLVFSIPVTLFIVLQLLWNYYRFGAILATGSKHQTFFQGSFRGNLLISLPANLLSLNRSIFVFSPPLILFFFSIKNLIRKYNNVAIILLGIVVTNIILYSKFTLWQASASWGPRFLVPITPFLMLPVCLFVSKDKAKIIFTTIIAIIGVTSQLLAVLLPLQSQAIDVYFGEQYYKPVGFFLKSEILPQAKMLFAGNFELWWFDSSIKLVAGIFLIIICLVSLYFLIRTNLAKNRNFEIIK